MGIRVVTSAFEQLVIDGHAYSVSFVDAAVADAGLSEIRVLTSTDPIVLFASIFGSGDADLQIYEAATISGGGSLTSYNLNRNSSNTTGITVTSNPTVTATGSTLILDAKIPSTVKKDAVPFAQATSFPRILKTSTEYLIRYTNDSGSAEDISWVLQFGEVQ